MQDYIASRSEHIRRKRRRKFILYAGAIVLLALFVGIFFFIRSDAFQLRDIRINETRTIIPSDVEVQVESFISEQSPVLKWFFGNENIALISTNALATSIKESFPAIQDISIEKNIADHSLSLSITEREKTGLWCKKIRPDFEEKKCIWFDKSGIAFLEGLQAEGNVFHRIEDETGRTVKIGDAILPKKELDVMFRIYDFLESVEWDTRTLIFEDAKLGEVRTQTVQNEPILYFSLTNNPTYAISLVRELKNKPLEYIDLRVESRIYYK